MEYKIVFTGKANDWRHDTLGSAASTEIATSMVEGLAPDYARRLNLSMQYNAASHGINGGVEAGIELYDYTTKECVAVVGYLENDEHEEGMNTCAVCLWDYDEEETSWQTGFRPKDSDQVITGYVCDDCLAVGQR